MSMFSAPSAPSGGIAWKDHNGALLLIDVLGVESGIQTAYGVSDATRANIVVLDGPGAGDSYDDTLIFPKLLHSQTKGQVGQKVLGRLGQGEKKGTQDPPWILREASAEDTTKAEAWVKQNQPTTTAPAAPF